MLSGQTYMGTLGSSQVDRIIVNGDYEPESNDYDIALMRLSSPITVGGKSLAPRSPKQKGCLVLLPSGGLIEEQQVLRGNLTGI